MNPVRKQRLLVVLGIVTALALAVGLMLYALTQNINLFYTPAQVVSGEAPVGSKMRVGGLVVPGSVVRSDDGLASEAGLSVRFDLTDGVGSFTVHYSGILPDLFREGQGIVANGKLVNRGYFEAEEVLAKHDETYMPPEVQRALEQAGHPADAGKTQAPGDDEPAY